jgi:hypothetical protein
LQSAVGIFLGNGDDQPKVSLGQLFFGYFGLRFAAPDNREAALQIGQPDFTGVLDFLDF